MIAMQSYMLALLAALYLFRGMLEFPATGWRGEVKLTVAIGLGLLPVLAGLSASRVPWGKWAIGILCALGLIVNAVLLIRLWKGLTNIAATTIVICLGYAAVIATVLM